MGMGGNGRRKGEGDQLYKYVLLKVTMNWSLWVPLHVQSRRAKLGLGAAT